jgi:hypothetical protein
MKEYRTDWLRPHSPRSPQRPQLQHNSRKQILKQLPKSSASTDFYEAVPPERRDELKQCFLETLRARHVGEDHVDVVHEYMSCKATNTA